MTPTDAQICVYVTSYDNETFYILRLFGIQNGAIVECIDPYFMSTEDTLEARLDALDVSRTNLLNKWNNAGYSSVTPQAPSSPWVTLTARIATENNIG